MNLIEIYMASNQAAKARLSNRIAEIEHKNPSYRMSRLDQEIFDEVLTTAPDFNQTIRQRFPEDTFYILPRERAPRPSIGDMAFDTTTGTIYVHNSSGWTNSSSPK